MRTVFFSVGMSLDGSIAPEGMDRAHADDPTYQDWLRLWSALQETFNRTGVSIMGTRMFEGGERFWPEEAPFHTPVFVLTQQMRRPWERPGGTTFYFVNDGTLSALRQAREAAGGRDSRIAGGANTILSVSERGPRRRVQNRPGTGLLGRGHAPLRGN